jgi:hypothetical protein
VSERDVVFTPFMLRVRETVTGASDEYVTLHFEASRPIRIAVAVDEWFSLRARAEQVIAEANAMLDQGADRIQLEDEFGTGQLAFVLRWRKRSCRVLVYEDRVAHLARVEVQDSTRHGALKPVNQTFLEDLTVSLLSPHPAGFIVDQLG